MNGREHLRRGFTRVVLTIVVALAGAERSGAEALKVAVASNFLPAVERLTESFEANSGHSVAISAGSTGKLYAQIVNGAPFDVLLAADARRPALLEERGIALAGSRFTYALGRLVLWSRDPTLRDTDCRAALLDERGKIAIANPSIAPYGEAARSTLQALGDWRALQVRLVTGENVAQALHFAASGNARFGFVAEAQLSNADLPAATCRWPVPQRYHAPIEQQAVLLGRARDSAAAGEFVRFLRGPAGRRIVEQSGYDLPGGE